MKSRESEDNHLREMLPVSFRYKAAAEAGQTDMIPC